MTTGMERHADVRGLREFKQKRLQKAKVHDELYMQDSTLNVTGLGLSNQTWGTTMIPRAFPPPSSDKKRIDLQEVGTTTSPATSGATASTNGMAMIGNHQAKVPTGQVEQNK